MFESDNDIKRSNSIVESELIATVIERFTAGFHQSLYRIYNGGMIRSPYRGRIIGYDLKPVQDSYSTAAGSTDTVDPDLSEFAETPETDDQNQEGNSGGGPDPAPDGDRSDANLAYGYARQSDTDSSNDDDNEFDESASIETQKRNIIETADEHGFDLYKIFVDEDESGFSFEREGFQELLDNLEQQPAPVILDRVNRLGRDVLETMYTTGKFHYEYEVPLITHRHGEYDFESLEDQILLVARNISARQSVEDRIRSSWQTIRTRFQDHQFWYTWFKKVPVGFTMPEDGSWPKVVESAPEVITAIMEDLSETKKYSKTVELIETAAKNETLDSGIDVESELVDIDGDKIRSVFEASDYELESFDGSKLRRMVTNPIYIGEIRVPRYADEEDQTVMEFSEFQVVDEDLFERVNSVVEEIAQQNTHSSDEEDSVDIETLADKGLIVRAIDEIDVVKPVCPECNRGMVKNGKTTLDDGRDAHFWVCPKYNEGGGEEDVQRKVPYEEEWETLKNYLEEEHQNASDILVLRVHKFD